MFRLRKVLEWKERLEKVARLQRMAAEQTARELEDRIRGFASERDSLPETTTGGDASLIEELEQWSRFAEALRRRERDLRTRLEAFRPELDRTVAAHQDLRVEVKGLHKLKERVLSRRRKERDRKVQEMIDDAAARRKLPGPGRDFPGEPVARPVPAPDTGPGDARNEVRDPRRGTRT